MRRRTVQQKIRSFVSVLRSGHVTPFDRGKTKSANFTKNWNRFEECSVFANGKCLLSRLRGEKLRCKFLARKMCKTHRQFQCYEGDVTFVSVSLSHRAHLTK